MNMEASHIGESSGSSGGGLRNRHCHCGRRAVIKISESQKNPNRLYAKCTDNKCSFFDWLGPPTQQNEKIGAYRAQPAATLDTTMKVEEIGQIWHRIYMLEAVVGVLKTGFIGYQYFVGFY